MGFKPNKENIYSTMKARLKKAEEELAYERTTAPMLRVFAERLGQLMLVQLAQKPYESWPQFAKDCFAWIATDMPTAAHFYRESLPKG